MKFSSNQVENLKNEMQSIINDISNTLNEITNIYNRLNRSGDWFGDASQIYTTKLGQVVSKFNDVDFELRNAVIYLQNVLNDYASLDKKIILEASNIFNFGR